MPSVWPLWKGRGKNVNNRLLRPSKAMFVLLLAPGVVWFVFAVIVPLLGSLVYSFFSFRGMRADRFAGLGNYLEMVRDPIFWQALKNNLVITVLCIVGQLGLALILASILHTRLVKLKNLHRAAIFFPGILSMMVVGFIWTIMYNKDFGLINFLLRLLRLDFLILPWLDNPRHVLYFVSLPIVWQYIGYYTVIIMAGMSSIPKEVYEMTDIDGFNGWQKLVYITMPLLKNTLSVCLMLCISGNMQVFDHIYVMTLGGPGTSSTVLALYAYGKTFTQVRIAYGNTISIGILIISLALILLSRKLVGGGKGDD